MEQENNNLLKNEDIIVDDHDIKNLIYTIRGKQVMLDSDVAMLYHYETKQINQTVKRNIDRFPENFCFQLTEEEFVCLRSQIVTLNKRGVQKKREDISLISSIERKIESTGRGKHRKYMPYVFTEQGIAMLSGLLKNEIAVQVSINIMNAFVEMRRFFISNGAMVERLTNVEYKMLGYDKKFDILFNELQKNGKQEFKQKIFYEGQIYDAYSLIIKIIRKAKEKITIIDNYIDDTILDMLAKKNKDVKVVILTSNKSNIAKIDIQKFNKEYPTLEIGKTKLFHDRFIIVDSKELYHCGASLKDLGKKCFAISKMESIEFIDKIET